MGWLLVIILILQLIVTTQSNSISLTRLVHVRGGSIPLGDANGNNYFDKFELDYGTDRNRSAGSLRGVIKEGKLSKFPQPDSFLKWFNEYLEKGPTPLTDRVKAYYATDFGTKADLQKGENPKIIIVNRKLEGDQNGVLKPAKMDVDVEIREIWQPWLKPHCNFVVRYIVPNRINLIRIMQSKGLFTGKVEIEEAAEPVPGSKTKSSPKVWAKMIFRAPLWKRLVGAKDVELKYELGGKDLLR